MNDLQHTFDIIHCQIFFKANFRFDVTFYLSKVGQTIIETEFLCLMII